MSPQPHPPIDETPVAIDVPQPLCGEDWRHLNDIEQSLLAIEGLFEAVCELSAASNPSDRRLSAICAVSIYLLDETKRAKSSLRKVFEQRQQPVA